MLGKLRLILVILSLLGVLGKVMSHQRAQVEPVAATATMDAVIEATAASILAGTPWAPED